MAYHEGFWVVVGTAAPVLAVASAVTRQLILDAVVAAQPAADQNASFRLQRVLPRRGMSGWEAAFLWTRAAMLLNVVLLLVALWALGTERDPVWLAFVGLLLGISFMLLLAQSASAMRGRMEDKRRREPGDGTGSTGP